MSALDIGARGIARRARLDFERTTERNASLAMRSEPTAAALEALAAEHSLLTGEPGATYTVEKAPFLKRDRLIIRGNGAELRNVNQTPLDVDHTVGAALPLGVSMVWSTSYLTYYPVTSATGLELTLAPGAGANFAPGDLVVLHGATKFYGPGDEYEVFRNYLRARVLEASADGVVIDRALPAQLLADSPLIGNTAENMPTSLPGAGTYYLLYAPHISHLTIASDVADVFQQGGVIDGVFRDLTIEGRNGLVVNALQDCLFENIRFRAWRKICELAEGSYGTVVRGMRGTLTDASTRFGGASDAPTMLIGLGENCAECVLEDFAVDSGPNDVPSGAAVIIGSGRHNEFRNSRLRFPAVTVPILSIQPNATLGHPTVDCGFRNLTVTAPVCAQFFACNEAGSGVVRPYVLDSRFYGAPTLRAATLNGRDGRLGGNFFENGDVYLAGATTKGWRVEGNTINGAMVFQGGTNNIIRGNYVRDGFQGLTDSFLKLNTVVDNESEASRRLDDASLISNVQTSITTTSPNTAYGTATFAAGDLSPGDKIYFSASANTSSAGTTGRFARVSLTQNSTTTGLGSHSIATPATPIGIEGVIEIRTDTFLVCDFSIGGKPVHSVASVASVAANGLTVNLEYWVSAGNEQINLRGARIVAVKPGMKHLPVN
jgi:hypothetical protein